MCSASEARCPALRITVSLGKYFRVIVLANLRISAVGRNWNGGTLARKATTFSVTIEVEEVAGDVTGNSLEF